MRNRNRRGFSLIEILIASVILAIVAGATFLFFATSSASVGKQATTIDIETKARAILEEITKDLKKYMFAAPPAAGVVDLTLVPLSLHPSTFAGNTVTPDLTTRIDWSWTAGPLVAGLAADPTLDPDNNVDDDADGLIDESYILRTVTTGLPAAPVPVAAVRARNATGFTVPPAGGPEFIVPDPPGLQFVIVATGNGKRRIDITVTLQALNIESKANQSRRIVRSFTTSVIMKTD